MNLLGEDVRGHRHASPRDRAAPSSMTSELRFMELPAAMQSTSSEEMCEMPVRLRFAFTALPTRSLIVSKESTILGTASAAACDDGEYRCDFEIIPHGEGWVNLRSVLTGRFVSLHHSAMPETPSWLGIHPPRAKPKDRDPPSVRARAVHASAVRFAKSGQCQCPLKGMRRPPAGWTYNCSLWAPLIDEYLSPWREGNVTATILDMAFWRQIYGEERAHALPGVHVSISRRDGAVRMRENVDYRVPLFRDMMRTVKDVVTLPEVEFVACLFDHPKVDRQTPLPVFVHYADASHRDVPMPAPWSWDDKAHSFPQPWTRVHSSCRAPWASRDPKLYFRGGCNGPTRGWRGPLWKFYPRKRANRLSHANPSTIDAGVYDHCDSPKLSKLEWGWDAEMEREMFREGRKKPVEQFAANCKYKHLLHIDGNLASSRLASELHVGSTIFKQESFSNEYFYPLLKPYVHYVPVAANLQDVPEKLRWAKSHPGKAEAIAQAGQQFAREHLHLHSIACYWWQLLTTFGALQEFEPRTSGFKPI